MIVDFSQQAVLLSSMKDFGDFTWVEKLSVIWNQENLSFKEQQQNLHQKAFAMQMILHQRNLIYHSLQFQVFLQILQIALFHECSSLHDHILDFSHFQRSSTELQNGFLAYSIVQILHLKPVHSFIRWPSNRYEVKQSHLLYQVCLNLTCLRTPMMCLCHFF